MHSVIEANNKFLSTVNVVNARGCSIQLDNVLKEPVLVLKGTPSQTRVQLPREDRPLTSLNLKESLLVGQLFLFPADHFAVELTATQTIMSRVKLVIGTYIKEARFDDGGTGISTAYLPLVIPRNKWVQVVFHIMGIITSIFGLQPPKCIDSITLAGTGKLCRLLAHSDEQTCIDATPPGMPLFAVPAYAPPIWATSVKHEAASTKPLTALPTLSTASCHAAAAAIPQSPISSLSKVETPSMPSTHLKPLDIGSSPPPLVPSPKKTNSLSAVYLDQKPDVVVNRSESSNKRSSVETGSPCGSDVPHVKDQGRSYIRLVEEGNRASGSQPFSSFSFGVSQRQQSGDSVGHQHQRDLCSWAANSWDGLSGWEDDSLQRLVLSHPSSACGPSKADVQKRTGKKPSSKTAAGATPNGAQMNERTQRLVASRRRQAPVRQSSLGCEGGSNSSRRRQRLRRRLRILRANEQKTNKAIAAQTLVASEMPLSKQMDAIRGSEETNADGASPFAAPICGYGFGYLGVLKANGEYEEDDEANMNLKGALTLQLSDDEE